MKRLKKYLLWVNVFFVLLTLLAYLAPLIHPTSFSFISLFGLGFPVLFFTNLFFVILWISFRKWYFLISVGCIIVGWSAAKKFIQLGPINNQIANTEDVVNVMNYNMHWLWMFTDSDDTPKDELIDRFTGFMKNEVDRLDILCMEEATAGDEIGKILGMPHTYRSTEGPTWLLSRFPIVDKGVITFKGYHSLCIWADLNLGEEIIRVYALHLSSNKITSESESLMENINLQDTDTWVSITGMLGKYSNAAKIRSQHAEIIKDHMDKCIYPVLLCGDFNDVPQSYTYRVLGAGMRDSFVECGRGIGSTYAGRLPGLRIDYIFASRHFDIMSHKVIRERNSDHYPVFSQVQLKD